MMGKMEMHVAFEAARLIETEPRLGLTEQESFLDPDADDFGNIFVVVSVADDAYPRVSARMPSVISVLNKDVCIIVKPLSMRMN